MADIKEDTKKLETKPAAAPKAATAPKSVKPDAAKKPVSSTSAAAAKTTAPKAEKKDAPKADKAEKKADKAEKKEEKKYIREAVHTINLREAFARKRTDRANRAVREIRRYVAKHTRKDAIIDPSINEILWANGIQSAPRRIKVLIKEDEKTALVTKA